MSQACLYTPVVHITQEAEAGGPFEPMIRNYLGIIVSSNSPKQIQEA